MNWLLPALLSAIFAAATAILAKIGVRDINSNLATGIRTIIILLFAWGIIAAQGAYKGIQNISAYTFVFLVASGITTGLSWLFYFRALQLGSATHVAPIDKLSLVFTIVLAAIILREKMSFLVILGTVFMSIGAVLISLG